jgi:hypothetical protein
VRFRPCRVRTRSRTGLPKPRHDPGHGRDAGSGRHAPRVRPTAPDHRSHSPGGAPARLSSASTAHRCGCSLESGAPIRRHTTAAGRTYGRSPPCPRIALNRCFRARRQSSSHARPGGQSPHRACEQPCRRPTPPQLRGRQRPVAERVRADGLAGAPATGSVRPRARGLRWRSGVESAGVGSHAFRCSGVPVFRCSGVPVFRCSGVRVFGCSGVRVSVRTARRGRPACPIGRRLSAGKGAERCGGSDPTVRVAWNRVVLRRVIRV